MDSGHLRGEHRFNLIAEFDALNDREQEIDSPLVDVVGLLTYLGELANKMIEEIPVCRSESFHKEN